MGAFRVPDANKKLVLEDGAEYVGTGFGYDCDRVFEVVFNTSMVGYQEILSDPSYTDQAVVMTYPLIGNYGIADEDYETGTPTIGGLIVREYNDIPSNFRYTKTLSELMADYRIPGIAGLDTRMLTRSIRDLGSRRALLTGLDTSREKALSIIRETPVPRDAVARVSCAKPWYSRTMNAKYNVVAIDCGIKYNIIRSLTRRGCNVTVMPHGAAAADVLKMKPDGLFLSNGPGDPQDAEAAVELVRALRGKLPIFGVCLGHQVIGLACGGSTYKLKFGHRGGNHPVMELATGKLEITSQNHSYAVDEKSLAGTGLTVTHRNLLDGTVEGLACEADRMFSVQYHPESAPGPQDSAYLFDRFLALMKGGC